MPSSALDVTSSCQCWWWPLLPNVTSSWSSISDQFTVWLVAVSHCDGHWGEESEKLLFLVYMEQWTTFPPLHLSYTSNIFEVWRMMMMIINQFVLCHCIKWRIFVDICKKAEERWGDGWGNLNGPSSDQRGINTAHNLLVSLINCN